MIEFSGKLKKFQDTALWHYYLEVPHEFAQKLIAGKDRRVLCSLNGNEEFQCAIMHGKEAPFFININKTIRNKFELQEGSTVNIILKKDSSEYGLPFPESFREVLISDSEAQQFFDKLSPGKQRNLLYIVNKVKSEEKQISKSLVIAAHLKKMNGNIDFKLLNQDFKDFK